MALLPREFTDVPKTDEVMGDFTPIPEGEYNAKIVKSSVENCSENAKDPNGKYIKLEFEIIDGKYKGRKLWTNLNIINKNPQAVEIAQKELNTIQKAIGIVGLKDTDELHGKPMKIKVGMSAPNPNYPPRNEIKFYYKIDGNVSQPTEESKPKQEPQQGETAPKKKPWE